VKKIELTVISIIIIFVAFSPEVMFDHSAVFALLAPGPHTSFGAIFFFLSFLFLRLFVIFFLPSYIVVRAFTFIYKRYSLGTKSESPLDS
jgi:hypothetical protein